MTFIYFARQGIEPEEPSDWKPADRCYFCVDGEPRVDAGGGAERRAGGGATVSHAYRDKDFWQLYTDLNIELGAVQTYYLTCFVSDAI